MNNRYCHQPSPVGFGGQRGSLLERPLLPPTTDKHISGLLSRVFGSHRYFIGLIPCKAGDEYLTNA